MMAPLWLLIGSWPATDHIVTVTDGITKVTDHFVMETLLETGVGGGESVCIPLQNVCALFRVKDKQRKLHTGGGKGKRAFRVISRFPNNS